MPTVQSARSHRQSSGPVGRTVEIDFTGKRVCPTFAGERRVGQFWHSSGVVSSSARQFDGLMCR
jgi:hypothetical protein